MQLAKPPARSDMKGPPVRYGQMLAFLAGQPLPAAPCGRGRVHRCRDEADQAPDPAEVQGLPATPPPHQVEVASSDSALPTRQLCAYEGVALTALLPHLRPWPQPRRTLGAAQAGGPATGRDLERGNAL